MEEGSKRDRGFIDTKKEMLWIEWQTLTRHYTDDQLIIGEWFYDIYEKYSEPIRFLAGFYSRYLTHLKCCH